MPSPTRAMIVSSVAPPTKRSRFVRTVTRALTLTPMPSLATPSMVVLPADCWRFGQSMTLGLMLVRTASSTVLPVPFGGEVDGAGAVEVERDAGLVRGDERQDDMAHVAAGEVMRLQRNPFQEASPPSPR